MMHDLLGVESSRVYASPASSLARGAIGARDEGRHRPLTSEHITPCPDGRDDTRALPLAA
jgi:hypothetical protein